MKEKLKRIQMAEDDQLLESLQSILRSIDQQKLNGVFQPWLRQVQKINS
jgi:hypothetical protein